MKKLMILIINIIVLISINSCEFPVPVSSYAGIYVLKKHENTYDTLKIFNDNTYEHTIYNKKGILILEYKNIWEEARGQRIFLKKYYENLDFNHDNKIIEYQDVVVYKFAYIYWNMKDLIIDVHDYDLGLYYYKIKDF